MELIEKSEPEFIAERFQFRWKNGRMSGLNLTIIRLGKCDGCLKENVMAQWNEYNGVMICQQCMNYIFNESTMTKENRLKHLEVLCARNENIISHIWHHQEKQRHQDAKKRNKESRKKAKEELVVFKAQIAALRKEIAIAATATAATPVAIVATTAPATAVATATAVTEESK
jgi:hypothetical protein